MAIEINRKKYQEIRKMDHNQMNKYLNSVYENGYQAGKSDAQVDPVVSTVDISSSAVRDAIMQVKGIGEKKAQDIMNAISGVLAMN